MKTPKILFLDLGGTIRKPPEKMGDPDEVEIIVGADKAVDYYHHQQWLIVGVTNQGGVAAGYKTLAGCIRKQQRTLALFPELHAILFCPDFEGRECWRVDLFGGVENIAHLTPDLSGSFRKPGSGMLQLALRQFSALPQDCLMVGDQPADRGAAIAAAIEFQEAQKWRALEAPPTGRRKEE